MRSASVCALVLVIGQALGLMVGCGGSSVGAQGPGAQSVERQSEAEYDLARDSFYKGAPRAALDHALKAVQLDDENAKALYFTSTVYLWFCSTDAGLKSPDCRLADADTYARKALKADDTFRDARNLLGQILILEKKYDEAITTLEPLTKDPAYTANYLAWGNLGWAQVLNGQVDAGIASLRNAITQPRFCVGHYRLGLAFEKKGDMLQAEKALTDAISVESPDCQNLQDAWEARAHVRMKLGHVADARADYQRCRDISAESQTGKSCAQSLGAAGGASTTSVTSSLIANGANGANGASPVGSASGAASGSSGVGAGGEKPAKTAPVGSTPVVGGTGSTGGTRASAPASAQNVAGGKP